MIEKFYHKRKEADEKIGGRKLLDSQYTDRYNAGMENRTEILKCALDLFAARGYDGVGVQEIVEAAGVTKPTLYHYFGSKQGLLKALLDIYQQALTESVQRAVTYRGDLPRTLENIARAYFTFAQQNPVFYRMQLSMVFAPRQSEAFQMVSAGVERQHALVEAMFAAAVREHGNMRGRQRLYALTFTGMINTCVVLWLQGQVQLDDALVNSVLHQFQHGVYS